MAPAQAETPTRTEEEEEEEGGDAAHHPSAPPSELFDNSTTIDPSYIISLIRNLLPDNVRDNRQCDEVKDHKESVEAANSIIAEETTPANSSGGSHVFPSIKPEAMETLDVHEGLTCQHVSAEDSIQSSEKHGMSARELAWEECGCILWDLAASRTHAEFMVENLILDVLLASLSVFQSVRITEISLGILANLACHEIPRNRMISMKDLIGIVIDQLLLEDSTSLCEACRLLTSGLQGSGSVTWAEALQAEHVLLRILWIAENTLNPQLLEKSIGLLLAMVDEQHNVAELLLPPLMKLGLANILVNLLASEVKNLSGERIPDRYSILDMILQVIEALSVAGNCNLITLKKDLLMLNLDLVKLPDKVEISSSCATAVVLLANMFTDYPDLVSEVSHDFSFLQGLLDIIPFVSDDPVARTALWSVVARVLTQESEISPSILHGYVTVLVDMSDIIEEDLVDHKQEDTSEDGMGSNSSELNSKMISLRRIGSMLEQWTAIKDSIPEIGAADDGRVARLLYNCHKYAP